MNKFTKNTIAYIIGLIALTTMLAGCMPQPSHRQVKSYSLKNIKYVNIQGPFVINVRAGHTKPHLTVNAFPFQLNNLSVSRKHHKFSISTSSVYPYAPHLTLFVNRLNALSIDHALQVKIHARRPATFNTLNLSNIKKPVSISGNLVAWNINLNYVKTLRSTGSLTTKRITPYQRNYQLTLHNVYSPKLYVEGGQYSQLSLAGKVKELHVLLAGRARFDSPNLHAKKAYIKAYGHSYASLHVSKLIFAHSTKTSVIEYTGHPQAYHKALYGSAVLPLSKN